MRFRKETQWYAPEARDILSDFEQVVLVDHLVAVGLLALVNVPRDELPGDLQIASALLAAQAEHRPTAFALRHVQSTCGQHDARHCRRRVVRQEIRQLSGHSRRACALCAERIHGLEHNALAVGLLAVGRVGQHVEVLVRLAGRLRVEVRGQLAGRALAVLVQRGRLVVGQPGHRADRYPGRHLLAVEHLVLLVVLLLLPAAEDAAQHPLDEAADREHRVVHRLGTHDDVERRRQSRALRSTRRTHIRIPRASVQCKRARLAYSVEVVEPEFGAREFPLPVGRVLHAEHTNQSSRIRSPGGK